MELMEEVLALAASQHAVLGRDQVRSLGGSRQWETRQTERGIWELVNRRVLRLCGSVDTVQQRLMAAVVDIGGGTVVSHQSAAWLWGLQGFAAQPAHVTALRDVRRHRDALGLVHEPRRLFPSHITMLDGIPVTSVVRTVFDLAPFVHPKRLEALVRHIVRRSPATLPIFHRTLHELARKGRAGIRVMREILSRLPIGSVLEDSGTEWRFECILADAGEPPLRKQVPLGGESFLGRVDYYDDELRLVFEIQSRTFHLVLPSDRQRDVTRIAGMAAAGLAVVELDEDDIFRNPAKVLWAVREARRARRAELLVDRSTR
ncbi:MAG TPA: hypothetical protein VD926_15400 [Acidimicrobiales bacterium]|nr:hypothetical protein [Acidimicrobiales bacterium]